MAARFSIDVAARIQGDDRAGVERLTRSCARPPFALERFHALGGIATLASPQARLLYCFPRPTPDGRTKILLSPSNSWSASRPTLRVGALVPPPRMHRHRYQGVLAPKARARSAVVAIGRPPGRVCGRATQSVEGDKPVLAYTPSFTEDLEHWYHDTFRAMGRRTDFGRSFVTFSLDERARITALELDGFGCFFRKAQPGTGRCPDSHGNENSTRPHEERVRSAERPTAPHPRGAA